MLWRQFIIEMTQAIVWPVVALVIAAMFRKPVVNLLSLLRKLQYKDMVAEFAELALEAKEDAVKALPEPVQQAGKAIAARFRELAESSPTGAIVDGWIHLERAVRDALEKHQVSVPLNGNPRLIEDALKRSGLLSEEQLRIYNRLRQMRNLAAHNLDGRVTRADANAFIDLAVPLAEYIESR